MLPTSKKRKIESAPESKSSSSSSSSSSSDSWSSLSADELEEQLDAWGAKPFKAPLQGGGESASRPNNVLVVKIDSKSASASSQTRGRELVECVRVGGRDWVPVRVAADGQSIVFGSKEPQRYVKASLKQLENVEKRLANEAKLKQLPTAIANAKKALCELTDQVVVGGDGSIELGDVGAISVEIAKLKHELKECQKFEQQAYRSDLVSVAEEVTLSVGYHELDGSLYYVHVMGALPAGKLREEGGGSLLSKRVRVSVCEESESTLLCAEFGDRSAVRAVEGKLVRVIGGEVGTADDQLTTPSFLCVSGENEVFVSDRDNHRIQVFDVATGAYLRQWGSEGTADGQFDEPAGVALDDQSGELFVADFDNDRVQVFDVHGRFLRKWGSKGSGPGQFLGACGTALVPEPHRHVFVCDNMNHRVQVFDRSGNFVRQFGTRGSGDGQFSYPRDLCFDSQRRLYVLDTTGVQVQLNPVSGCDALLTKVFDADGRFLRKWGRKGTSDGEFTGPWAIAADSFDRVFVTDERPGKAMSRVQVFDRDGRFLFKFSSDQLPGPFRLAFSPSGHLLATDFRLDHVCVFE